MRRVPEVIDVWFDSGSMPFAQFHAPHENNEHFEQRFPADFICEALDQTRGWFYSLLAISTLLFDRSSYRNVVCLGLILDEQGRKMSKSLGNAVEPWEVIDRYGADALRWYFFTSKLPWDGYRFSLETIGEAVRQFLLQLWNTYSFYVLYANANDVHRDVQADEYVRPRPLGALAARRDRRPWSASGSTTSTRPPPAARSRRSSTSSPTGTCGARGARFWDGSPAAFATLRDVPGDGRQAARPVLPVHRRRDLRQPRRQRAERPPVRLPGRRRARPRARAAMAVARETVRLGLAARAQAKLKVRQPLRAAVVVATGAEREAIERLADLVREELNVHELRFVSQADELGQVEIKPNYRTLGPRFGKQMPLVAAAVAGLDAAHAAAALRDGQSVSISVAGHDHELGADDLLVSDEAARGLPGRARGIARGRARARDRRRAARRGLGARHRARGPERPPAGAGSRSPTGSR